MLLFFPSERPLNWGGGMGFDLGDADFGAAPVAVLKNDLFDEISSQEGGKPLGWSWVQGGDQKYGYRLDTLNKMLYTLPETNIAHENPIFPGKYHQNGGFSMAMLVYRRVRKCRKKRDWPLGLALKQKQISSSKFAGANSLAHVMSRELPDICSISCATFVFGGCLVRF